VADDRDRLAFVQAHAVKDLGVRGHFRMNVHRSFQLGEHFKNARYRSDPGQNAILLGKNGRNRKLAFIDTRMARSVMRDAVFLQRAFQNAARSPA